jgi:hypothetical protein
MGMSAIPRKATLVAIKAENGFFADIAKPVPNCQINALNVKRKNKKLTLDSRFLRVATLPVIRINIAAKKLGIA